MADKDLLTLEQVAERMHVGVKTVQRRIAESGLMLPRPGRTTQLTEKDYELLLASTRSRSPQPDPIKAKLQRAAKRRQQQETRARAKALRTQLRQNNITPIAREREE